MSLWTLRYSGESKTLAEWGVRSVRRALVNQSTDYLTFNQPTAEFAAAPLFTEGGIVELFREEERWFYGRAEDPIRTGDARRIGLSYDIAGPWWWLENMGFRQSWNVRDQEGELEERFTSVCLLGTTINGQLQSLGDQIAEAVNYAIGQGAPLALDTSGLPTVHGRIIEVWNESVANVIRQMLQFAPDTVAAIDYSTDPLPTIRFRRRSETVEANKPTRVTLPALDERLIPQLELRARNDLKVPGVIIYYLRSDTENGFVYSTVAEDVYPPGTTGREPKALVAAINLEGAHVTYAQATVRCETIDVTSADWWKARRQELNNYQNLLIEPPGATGVHGQAGYAANWANARSTELPREFIGQHAGWMGGTVQEETIQALASYDVVDGDVTNTIKREPISIRILATDLESGTYRSNPGGSFGETQPVGLAEALYNATKDAHYDGLLVLKEAACSGLVGLGNLVNLEGGLAEWATMNAQVQQVTEEIDTGTTTVKVGPPKHLGPDDYMELLRATRFRMRVTPLQTRATGVGSQVGSAVLGEKLSKEVPSTGKGAETKKVFHDPTGAMTQRVTIDPSVLPAGANGQFQGIVYSKRANGACSYFYRQFLCGPERAATAAEVAAAGL